MLRKDRFLSALKHGKTDRLPMFDFLFQQPLYERLIGVKPASYNGADAVKCALALDHDGVWIQTSVRGARRAVLELARAPMIRIAQHIDRGCLVAPGKRKPFAVRDRIPAVIIGYFSDSLAE